MLSEEGVDSMAKRRVSPVRSRAGKRAYRKRQRREAVKELGEGLLSIIPSIGTVRTVHNISKAVRKFRQNC